MAVDLLAFGPHPDDIEIGLGGVVARHAALGFSVGLCDLTQGEMGSNGTIDERAAEAAEATKVLGCVWRENLRWADRRIGKDPAHLEHAVAFIRQHRPRVIAVPYWSDRHPDHTASSAVLTEAAFNSGLRRYPADGDPWRPEWICYYFLNDAAPPSFVIDVTDHYEQKRRSLDCHVSQFATSARDTVATRLNTRLFRQMIESRDAQFGAAAGVTWAEGIVVREPILRPTLMRTTPAT
jgi:N-acetylglucosamine malate deacetylase 1